MNKLLILSLMIFVTFISGCTTTDTPENGPYIGGNKGLSLSFEPASPLSEFGEDALMGVKVKVSNNGETEIMSGTSEIRLYGLSNNEFASIKDSLVYKNIEQGLFPAQKGISETGGEASIDLGQIDYSGIIGGDFVDRPLSAEICYPYKTMASIEACISSKTVEEVGTNDVCDYTGEKVKSGFVSSGPIQVTTFTEELRGVNQISFKIGFKDNGLGTVYDYTQECTTFSSDFSALPHKGKIFIELNPTTIQCSFPTGQSSSGYLTLDDKVEKILVCTLNVDQDSEYIQGVNINVNYKYIESVTKNIRILRN